MYRGMAVISELSILRAGPVQDRAPRAVKRHRNGVRPHFRCWWRGSGVDAHGSRWGSTMPISNPSIPSVPDGLHVDDLTLNTAGLLITALSRTHGAAERRVTGSHGS